MPHHPRRRTAALAVVALLTALAVPPATADPGVVPPSPAPDRDASPGGLTPSYLWDGGALPFLWGSLAAAWALDRYVEPPATPRWFSADEGGAPSQRAREVPSWAIDVFSGVAALTMLAGGDDARWFHLKGFAEALATTSLVTVAGKVTFGRRRPDYAPDDPDPGQRKSFPSGHASRMGAAVTYLGLYLRFHAFDRVRGARGLPWWEAATYVGLAGLGAAVAAERVLHDRHNVGDVVVGAAVGAAASAAFFTWQERRYRRARNDERSWQLAPQLAPGGLGMSVRGTY